MVDHEEIEEAQWVDRYVLGTLSEADQQQFSDHFMNCPHCLEELELAEAFQRDLKIVTAEEAGKNLRLAGLLALWLRGRLTAAALIAAAVLAVFLGISYNQPGALPRVPTIDLESPVRGAAAAATRLDFAGADSLVLTRQVMFAPYQRFQITLLDGAGKELYRDQDLVRDGTVSVRLTRAMLDRGGEYRLRLAIAEEGGAFTPFADYQLSYRP